MKEIDNINTKLYKEIGTMIKDKREAMGLAQQEVANYVGVSKSAVSRWESGEVENMGRSKIHSLSKILNISPVSIVMGKVEEETDESPLEEEDPSIIELKEKFEKLYPKIINLPQDEKDKLLKMINIYLAE